MRMREPGGCRLLLEQPLENGPRLQPARVGLVSRVLRRRKRQSVEDLRLVVLGVFGSDIPHGITIREQARLPRSALEVAVQLCDGCQIRTFSRISPSRP